MIVVKIKPSRLRVTFVVALHLAAAFSFVFGLELGLVAGSSVLVVLAWSLVRCIVASGAGLPMALGLKDDGGLLLQPDGGAEVDALPDGASVVLGWVLWLAWREQGGYARRGVVLIVSDQLTPSDWRRLQVWTRLRSRPAMVGAGAGGGGGDG